MHINDLSEDVNILIDQLEKWYEATDERFRDVVEVIGKEDFNGRKPSCQRCTDPGCCHQKLVVHLLEAFPIARRLRAEGRDTPELRARLRDFGERMEGFDSRGWFEQYDPCVFLEDQRCSIYEQRPTRCRYYVVFSEPEKCLPPLGKTIGAVDYTPVLESFIPVVRSVHGALELKENRKRILTATLPRAVLIFLEAMDSDDYRETIRRQVWPSDTKLESGWFEGNNPFGERLYQIRTKEGG